eukprot:Clim_evm29s243 gene=Clim_evmTU29s243
MFGYLASFFGSLSSTPEPSQSEDNDAEDSNARACSVPTLRKRASLATFEKESKHRRMANFTPVSSRGTSELHIENASGSHSDSDPIDNAGSTPLLPENIEPVEEGEEEQEAVSLLLKKNVTEEKNGGKANQRDHVSRESYQDYEEQHSKGPSEDSEKENGKASWEQKDLRSHAQTDSKAIGRLTRSRGLATEVVAESEESPVKTHIMRLRTRTIRKPGNTLSMDKKKDRVFLKHAYAWASIDSDSDDDTRDLKNITLGDGVDPKNLKILEDIADKRRRREEKVGLLTSDDEAEEQQQASRQGDTATFAQVLKAADLGDIGETEEFVHFPSDNPECLWQPVNVPHVLDAIAEKTSNQGFEIARFAIFWRLRHRDRIDKSDLTQRLLKMLIAGLFSKSPAKRASIREQFELVLHRIRGLEGSQGVVWFLEKESFQTFLKCFRVNARDEETISTLKSSQAFEDVTTDWLRSDSINQRAKTRAYHQVGQARQLDEAEVGERVMYLLRLLAKCLVMDVVEYSTADCYEVLKLCYTHIPLGGGLAAMELVNSILAKTSGVAPEEIVYGIAGSIPAAEAEAVHVVAITPPSLFKTRLCSALAVLSSRHVLESWTAVKTKESGVPGESQSDYDAVPAAKSKPKPALGDVHACFIGSVETLQQIPLGHRLLHHTAAARTTEFSQLYNALWLLNRLYFLLPSNEVQAVHSDLQRLLTHLEGGIRDHSHFFVARTEVKGLVTRFQTQIRIASDSYDPLSDKNLEAASTPMREDLQTQSQQLSQRSALKHVATKLF